MVAPDRAPRILVVDDTPANVKLLADVMRVKGYEVITAASGKEALTVIAAQPLDLVLLDVVMPEISGYEVCRAIRADAATAVLPVIMVTALDPAQERVRGLEAGADDFLTKPINQPELIARVRSLLRVKQYHDRIEAQAGELAQLNRTLEQRVADQVAQIERLGRLKRFFSPKLAELIVAGGAADPTVPHRCEVTVVFVDLRGFTAFAETSPPDTVMSVLAEYHAAMGQQVLAYEGTLERFAGDGIMIFFNDPLPVPDAAQRAIGMACAMRARFAEIEQTWQQRGHTLGMGIGIARGEATLGAIGFEGRWDYAAIGSVSNLAARLCAEAKNGQILIDRRTLASVASMLEAEPLGELALKGFAEPVAAFNVVRLKA